MRRKDEELEQAHQANQDLREGLKQAIIALGSQQERVNALEGLIDSQQERINILERQQAKESQVLPLKMVDNSTSPFQTHFGPVFG